MILSTQAPKKYGPRGATVVVLKEDILGKVNRTIPSMLDYSIHLGKDSMFNTPPVFSVYVSMLTLEWLKNLGGIPFIEQVNQKKADTIYAEIDRNPFEGVVNLEDRSTMNATFTLNNHALKQKFDDMGKRLALVAFMDTEVLVDTEPVCITHCLYTVCKHWLM